jgi:hypothetical protein
VSARSDENPCQPMRPRLGKSGPVVLSVSFLHVDPLRTSAVHFGNGFDGGFSPYQIARLSR